MNNWGEKLNKIANALLFDYVDVYYINAVTNEYEWFSIQKDTGTLKHERDGKDFFEDVIRDADKVIHEDDKHIFFNDIQKKNLLENLQKGEMKSIVYRHVKDGKNVWHSLRLIRGLEENDDYFIIGVLNIDEEVRKQREQNKLRKEAMTYNDIATQLAERYDTIYYVDLETDYYVEISSTDMYRAMNVPVEGKDFFEESVANARRIIHKKDQEIFIEHCIKEKILKKLEGEPTVQFDYQIIYEGSVIYARLYIMMTKDKKHLLYCVENRQAEHEAEAALRREKERSIIYGQIAESLASYYATIYYVNTENDSYIEFESSDIYKNLQVPDKGDDFFEESRKNIMRVVYPDDRDKVVSIMSKEVVLEKLRDKRLFTERYRLVIDDKIKYTRLSIMWAQDKKHLIVGIENIDDQVRALKTVKEKAIRDELTGVRNKNAFHEYESDLQKRVNAEEIDEFAIVMCDLNDLKKINDTRGHKAGDKYIKDSCKMICRVFTHSPVFRIGGDEFVAVLVGEDYENREELLEGLRKQVLENVKNDDIIVVATGMADYDSETDSRVTDVFERADKLMYKNKRSLKNKKKGN